MSNELARERSAPLASFSLQLSLLGPPEVTWDGHPLILPRRESRALLYRLATLQQAVPREELAFLFWPDSREALARRNLTFLLTNLRRSLPAPHWLLTADDTISLDWSLTQSDVVSFQQLASGASTEAQHTAREQAVKLVRGPFLAGFSLPGHPEFEAWVEAERSALERLYLEALDSLVQDYAATGDYRSAIMCARRYLATDELAEGMHRRLMALHTVNGERSAALRQFERCAVLLERELHIVPSPETRTVYQAILDGRAATDVAALAGLRCSVQEMVRIARRPTHNLPASVTSFVGRKTEIAHLRQVLSPGRGKTRLVTLTGAGGSGKTRLAFEVARGLLGKYQEGVWWMDLAPLSELGLVPQAVASVLGIKEQGERPLIETLQEVLRERRLRRFMQLLPNVHGEVHSGVGHHQIRIDVLQNALVDWRFHWAIHETVLVPTP